MSETKTQNLLEKASPKTILELVALHDAWKRTFREGAMGNHEAYNLARDTRPKFEEEKWIPIKGLVDELQKLCPDYDTLRIAPRGGETGTFFMEGYNKGFQDSKKKVLEALQK